MYHYLGMTFTAAELLLDLISLAGALSLLVSLLLQKKRHALAKSLLAAVAFCVVSHLCFISTRHWEAVVPSTVVAPAHK